MTDSPFGNAQFFAPQHKRDVPRPLPLFLDMLRRETAASPERRAAALAGLRRYQEAPRVHRRMKPARYRRGAARLRDGDGDPGAPSVVLVPSLINPPSVLDLARGRSLVDHLAGAGFRPWLLDWGHPRARDAALDLAGHVTERLLPLLARLDQPPLLVGYCLGGTLALAAAALLGPRCAGVATVAAPWRFAGYGEAARAAMRASWEQAEPACRALGVLPMEVLQSGFWQLDPARTVAKYETLATADAATLARFVLLEDWANAGAPLTYAAGAELFGALVGDDLSGNGAWRVGRGVIAPGDLACPSLEFVSLSDRIVPAATAAGLAERRDIGAGHVGMMVGGRARALLYDPLAEWLRGVAA